MNGNKVNNAINLIIEISKKYDMPWELGFSGGKDSTVVLSLLIEALKEGARIPKLYVVYADTLLEHPTLRKEALDVLHSLEDLKDERIVPVRLTPAEGNDFISMMIEKGYPIPHHRFRWCMARLKIRPMQRFLQSLGKYIQLSGVRSSESSERAKNIKHYANSQKVVDLGGTVLVMPILDWETSEVFMYLKTHRRWDGRSFDYLLNLYEVKEDSAGSSCGCSLTTDVRFGCWVCTVVKNDKMPVPELLKWARQRIIEISSNPQFREFQNGKPRKLNKDGRKEIAKVFLKVLKEYPEAFGYNTEELEEKLMKVLKE